MNKTVLTLAAKNKKHVLMLLFFLQHLRYLLILCFHIFLDKCFHDLYFHFFYVMSRGVHQSNEKKKK